MTKESFTSSWHSHDYVSLFLLPISLRLLPSGPGAGLLQTGIRQSATVVQKFSVSRAPVSGGLPSQRHLQVRPFAGTRRRLLCLQILGYRSWAFWLTGECSLRCGDLLARVTMAFGPTLDCSSSTVPDAVRFTLVISVPWNAGGISSVEVGSGNRLCWFLQVRLALSFSFGNTRHFPSPSMRLPWQTTQCRFETWSFAERFSPIL